MALTKEKSLFFAFFRIANSELKFYLSSFFFSNLDTVSPFNGLGVCCLVMKLFFGLKFFSKNLIFTGFQYSLSTISLTFFLFIPKFLSYFLNLYSLIKISVAIWSLSCFLLYSFSMPQDSRTLSKTATPSVKYESLSYINLSVILLLTVVHP